MLGLLSRVRVRRRQQNEVETRVPRENGGTASPPLRTANTTTAAASTTTSSPPSAAAAEEAGASNPHAHALGLFEAAQALDRISLAGCHTEENDVTLASWEQQQGHQEQQQQARQGQEQEDEDLEVRREWLLKLRAPRKPFVWDRRLLVAFRSGLLQYFREGNDGELLLAGEATLDALTLPPLGERAQESKPTPNTSPTAPTTTTTATTTTTTTITSSSSDSILYPTAQSLARDPRVVLFDTTCQSDQEGVGRQTFVLQANSVESASAWYQVLRIFQGGLGEGANQQQQHAHAHEHAFEEELAAGLGPRTQSLLLLRRQPLELRRCWFLKLRESFPQRWERRLFIVTADGLICYYQELPKGGLIQTGAIALESLELLPEPLQGRSRLFAGKQLGHHLLFSAVDSGKSHRRRDYVLYCSSKVALGFNPEAICSSWKQMLLKERERLRQQGLTNKRQLLPSMQSAPIGLFQMGCSPESSPELQHEWANGSYSPTNRGKTRLAAAQSLPSAFHVEPSVRGPELESFLLGVEGAQSNGNSGSPDGSTSSPSSSSAKFEQVYAEQASPLLTSMTKSTGKTGDVQSITPFLSESPSFFKEAARQLFDD